MKNSRNKFNWFIVMEYRFTRKADLNRFVRGLRKNFIIPVVDGKVVQVYKPAGLKESERIMRFADNLYKSIAK